MTRLPIEYHPAARYEVLDAFEWYMDRSAAVAARFQQDLDEAQLKIQASPEVWASYLHGTRRYLLKRFGYVVTYRVTDHHIQVIAVAHGRRKPGYWADRLKSAE